MRLFGRRKRVPDAPPTYWNSAVIDRIERDGGVDHDTAVLWWNELLLFLDLVAVSKEFVSPPEPVDVAWHAFILHTQDYESYCRERFGRIIHHQPTGQPDPRAYQRAYQRRSAYPAAVDNTIWPVPVIPAGNGDDGRPDPPGQSGDFAAGAATIGGADFASPGDAAGGDLDGAPGGGDFDGGSAGGDFGGGDFGESSSAGDSGGGDSGGSGGDSGGGSSCGGASCGGGSS
jgi:hypothetical protein